MVERAYSVTPVRPSPSTSEMTLAICFSVFSGVSNLRLSFSVGSSVSFGHISSLIIYYKLRYALSWPVRYDFAISYLFKRFSPFQGFSRNLTGITSSYSILTMKIILIAICCFQGL